ncbi:unnamed protein product [Ectocarpus sp. 12 AP-2014]
MSPDTVLVLAVDIGTNADAMAAIAVESPTVLAHVDAGGRGSSAPARVRSGGITAAVTAVPLRRVCVSDGSTVTFLAFDMPRSSRWGAGSSEQGDSGDSPPSPPRAALAVANGAMVSLFPLVTATASNIHDQQDNQLPVTGPTATARVTAGTTTAEDLAAAREATRSSPSRFTATSDERQPAAVTRRAHDHNVTGISTVPLAAPLSSTTSPPSLAGTCPSSSTTAPSGPGAPTTAVGHGKHRQEGEGGGGGSCANGAATSVGDAGAGRDGSGREGGAERARVGGKRRRREEGDAGGGCRRNGARAKALVYTCSMDGSCREGEVEVVVSPGGDSGGAGREGAAKARLRKTVSRLTKRGQLPPLKNPPPLLGCSASPNRVLVASLEFCRPERSTRKAVQNTARKGTHCMVVLTPMMPPVAERAATVTGGRDSSWNFLLSSGVLSTDWAWYIRTAFLGDAAVHSTREGMTPSSLIPTVRNALEDAIPKAAEVARARVLQLAQLARVPDSRRQWKQQPPPLLTKWPLTCCRETAMVTAAATTVAALVLLRQAVAAAAAVEHRPCCGTCCVYTTYFWRRPQAWPVARPTSTCRRWRTTGTGRETPTRTRTRMEMTTAAVAATTTAAVVVTATVMTAQQPLTLPSIVRCPVLAAETARAGRTKRRRTRRKRRGR